MEDNNEQNLDGPSDIEEIPRNPATNVELMLHTSNEIEKNLESALSAKETGNECFKRKEYDSAIQHYSLALAYCPDDAVEEKATFYGNRSAAYFAEEEYEPTIDDCIAALALKSDYLKVLARRMASYEKLDKLEEALEGKRLKPI
jgi:tetratricopeptide (TPR) repeat protein